MIKLKNEEQIAGIKRSCDLLSRLFAILKPAIQPGVSTGALDHLAFEFIKDHSGEPAFLNYMDYPASLCISINEEVIHGIPGKRLIRDSDVVGIDCGINLDGFFSDAAFTSALPPVEPAARQLVQVTEECLDRAIKAIEPGARVSAISRAVFSHAKAHGYGVVRQYCGHGVGFSQHEDPQVPNYVSAGPNPRLVPGMVLAIEPMINLGTGDVKDLDDGWTVVTSDGKLSAHFEHTVLVTATGAMILTAW